MRHTRGTTITPIISGLAFIAAISGGVLFGRQHPAVQHDALTTHGEWVRFANARGDSVRAYVAYPERSDKAPTVIVIHEIFGMTDWEPTVADKFAAKGYIAIAPDLLSSQYRATDSVKDRATQLVSALPDAQVIGDLDATYAYVNGLPAAQKDNTGIVGFCWGGGTVWKYAAVNPRVKAAVPCYGPVNDTARIVTVKAPVFAVYGEKDARVNTAIPGITAATAAHHIEYTPVIYPEMGHGFLKTGRPGADSPTADKARADIDAFFAKKLDHK
jgi:carboxymethylenebutenolidase